MEFQGSIIGLTLFTLIAVGGIGFWELRNVRNHQKKEGEAPGDANVGKRVHGE